MILEYPGPRIVCCRHVSQEKEDPTLLRRASVCAQCWLVHMQQEILLAIGGIEMHVFALFLRHSTLGNPSSERLPSYGN